MSDLRLAMIIQSFLPRMGGMERQTASLAPVLQAHGIDVRIVTRQFTGMKPYEEMSGVPVYRLPAPSPKAVASLAYTLSAVQLLKRIQPDVIHAHELFSPSTIGALASRLYKLPLVATLHRSGPPGDVQRLQQKFLGRQRLAYLSRHVHAFAVISREIDRELEVLGVPPERRHFIPNGVDIEHFAPSPAASKVARRKALGLPDGLMAVFVGRLAAEKQLDRLVLLWRDVRVVEPTATLLLVGVGDEEQKLRAMAIDGVYFTGSVNNVAPYLQAADLFVLPSTAEGLSVAMLEAMACGLPVIATAVGGAPDVIRHGENGWLVPPEDTPALQKAVQELLGDYACREKLGAEARKLVAAQYAVRSSAERLQMLYKQLAAQFGGMKR